MSKTNIDDCFNASTGFYDLVKMFNKQSPKFVNGSTNQSYWYWFRNLFNKIKSVLILEIDENIIHDIDYALDFLLTYGQIGVIDSKIGLTLLGGSPSGYNIFYKPSQYIYANPILGNGNLKIGQKAWILPINYYNNKYYGVIDIVNRYAELLASIDGSMYTNLMNSRLSYVMTGRNEAEIQTVKKAVDNMSKGEPFIFLEKASDDENLFSDRIFNFDVGKNFIAPQLNDLIRTIMNQFLTEIGINNSAIDKKERVNETESNSNNEEINLNITRWIDTFNRNAEIAKNDINSIELYPEIKTLKLRKNEKVINSLNREINGGVNNEFA